jgi:hypothetical protein
VRILILNYDYPDFISWLYTTRLGLERASFEEQWRERMSSLFGVADFYSSHFNSLGHEALEIQVNNHFIQAAWLRERGFKVPLLCHRAIHERASALRNRIARWRTGLHRSLTWRLCRPFVSDDRWLYGTIARQIEWYRPDVVLNLFLHLRPSFFASQLTPRQLLVGQHASPLPDWADLRAYDLIISSLPSLVEHFRRSGLHSLLHRLAFEPTVLDRLPASTETYDVCFVGSLSPAHSKRIAWLREISATHVVDVWGPGETAAAARGLPGLAFRGPAWGREMYRVLRDSRIILNQHIDMAGDHANNLRLFEATGVGSMLLTDAKADLGELFDEGREVVAYRSASDCRELLDYYLINEDARRAIAAAGQRRTLRDHTYAKRIRELAEMLEGELRRKRRSSATENRDRLVT